MDNNEFYYEPFYQLTDWYTESIGILQYIYGAIAEWVSEKHDARSCYGKHKWYTTGWYKTN